MIAKKGVASIRAARRWRSRCDVKMIACQMTMDLFEFDKNGMIDGITLEQHRHHGKRPEVIYQPLHLSAGHCPSPPSRPPRKGFVMADRVLDAKGSQLPAADQPDRRRCSRVAGRQHSGSDYFHRPGSVARLRRLLPLPPGTKWWNNRKGRCGVRIRHSPRGTGEITIFRKRRGRVPEKKRRNHRRPAAPP